MRSPLALHRVDEVVYEVCQWREDIAELTEQPDGDSHEKRRPEHATEAKKQPAGKVHDIDLATRAMEVVK